MFDLINIFVGPFGWARAKMPAGPRKVVVSKAIAVITERGGKKYFEERSASQEIETVYFRVRGKFVRLGVAGETNVTLWGPKHFVAETVRLMREAFPTKKSVA